MERNRLLCHAKKGKQYTFCTSLQHLHRLNVKERIKLSVICVCIICFFVCVCFFSKGSHKNGMYNNKNSWYGTFIVQAFFFILFEKIISHIMSFMNWPMISRTIHIVRTRIRLSNPQYDECHEDNIDLYSVWYLF